MQRLIQPINKMKLTASWATDSYYDKFGFEHYGADCVASNSTVVYASGNGVVVDVGLDNVVGSVIIVRYYDAINRETGEVCDVIFRYYHLSFIAVKKGTHLTKDVILGNYGSTGMLVMAAHLHMEADKDVDHPYHSPTVKSSNFIKGRNENANAKTMTNPLEWLYTKINSPDYQTYTTVADKYIREEDKYLSEWTPVVELPVNDVKPDLPNLLKILLDPGHTYNYNAGVVSSYREGNACFEYAGYLKIALEKFNNVKVDVTRTKVTDNPDVNARGKMAADGAYDMFLSLHTDAAAFADGSINKIPNGTTIFRSLTMNSIDVEFCDKLAELISSTIGTKNRGAVVSYYPGSTTSDYFAVVRGAAKGNVRYNMLIEHCFHTNEYDCNWFNSQSNLELLADEVAGLIGKYFSLTKKIVDNADQIILPWYRVRMSWDDSASQIGAYRDIERAIDVAIKTFGYSVYDENGNVILQGIKEFVVGDTVMFIGTRHYEGSNSMVSKIATKGLAKITSIAKDVAKHKYHLNATIDSESNVYGWVDEGDFTFVSR